MKTTYIVIILLLFNKILLLGQEAFHGSFIMSFSGNNVEEPPLHWNIESRGNGGKMALEIMDEMQKKGVQKRVIFNPPDSTWTMLLQLNNIKQGSRIRRAELFKKAEEVMFTIKETKERKTVSGFVCNKIILESKDYISELWMTDAYSFNTAFIYKLLSHCGMIGASVRSGSWYHWKNNKGMILEVSARKKSTGYIYIMNISGIKKGETIPALFETKGFMISNIPEGQNCGIPMEEK